MKYLFTLTFIIINCTLVLSQERFFILSNTWRTTKIIEYEDCYLSLGLGAVSPTSNHIQFSKLSKAGEPLTEWAFKLDSTHTTEFVYQQAVSESESGDKIIAGAITYPPETSRPIAACFKFNNDFTEYLDYHWIYNPLALDARTVFEVSMPITNGQMIYAANYSYNQKTHSVILQGDANGSLDWESSYECGNGCNMEVRHIIPAHDGGFLFTNHEKRDFSQTSRHTIFTIIKVNNLGEEQWRIYPGGVGESYSSEEILLVPTDDGNYLCAWTDKNAFNGFSYQTNPEATLWFAKINENGEKLWEKNIQEDIETWNVSHNIYIPTQMIKLSDNNLILAGYGSLGNIIIKLTQNADVLWARGILPTELESPNSSAAFANIYGIIETSDGGIACTGEANIQPGDAFPQSLQTGFVLKLDEYGCLEEGCHLDDPVVSVEEVVEESERMLVYPNPATDYVIINYKTSKTSNNLSLVISDIAGKIIYNRSLDTEQDEIILPTNEYPNGQYFCTLKRNNKTIITEKVILIK